MACCEVSAGSPPCGYKLRQIVGNVYMKIIVTHLFERPFYFDVFRQRTFAPNGEKETLEVSRLTAIFFGPSSSAAGAVFGWSYGPSSPKITYVLTILNYKREIWLKV